MVHNVDMRMFMISAQAIGKAVSIGPLAAIPVELGQIRKRKDNGRPANKGETSVEHLAEDDTTDRKSTAMCTILHEVVVPRSVSNELPTQMIRA